MYMILWWMSDYLTCVHNEDGSIKLFATLEEADKYIDKYDISFEMRVISIGGIKE